MTIVVTAVHGGREYSANQQDSTKDTSGDEYFVTGTDDIYAAYAAVAAEAPGFDGPLIRDQIKLKNKSCEHWEASVTYVDPEKKKKDPDIGQIEWDFDTTGGTQHITTSKQTMQVFNLQGFDTVPFFQAIGVEKKKTGFEVKGVDIVVPKLELTATTSFPPNVVTLEWIKAIAEITGKTNDAPWKGFDRGELLFMGARIKTKYREKTSVVFNFSASQNITAAHNVTIGDKVPGQGQAGLGPIVKAGHEYLWVYFIPDDLNGRFVMRPWQAMAERVYDEADYAELGLGN